MTLENQSYIITSAVESKPDLHQFNIVINPNQTNTNDFYMARIFQITPRHGKCVSLAVVDLLCAGYEPYAVLENHLLTMVQFQSIIRIDLQNYVYEYIECDNMGGLHEIHAIEDGYILWGEGDIFRYDRELHRLWQFMGRDILVSLHAAKHFWIEEDRIHCRDFLGWHYILDLNGKLLQSFREFAQDDP